MRLFAVRSRRLITSAGQAPLHGLRSAGIGAAGDNVEIAARLLQRL
jgi:hypothetical protein